MKSLLKTFLRLIFPFLSYPRHLEEENRRLAAYNDFLLEKIMRMTTGSGLKGPEPKHIPAVNPETGETVPQVVGPKPLQGRVDPYSILNRLSEISQEKYLRHLQGDPDSPLNESAETDASSVN